MKKKKMKQHIKDIWADISLFAQRFDTVHQELQETRQALADLRESHEFLVDRVTDLSTKLVVAETEIHQLKLTDIRAGKK